MKQKKRRKLKPLIVGLTGFLALGPMAGCKTLNIPDKLTLPNPYKEFFRTEPIQQTPPIEVDYTGYDERNQLVIRGDRAYPKGSPEPKRPLEEIVETGDIKVYKIQEINATYIEKPAIWTQNNETSGTITNGDITSNTISVDNITKNTLDIEKQTSATTEIILNYPCRIPPPELKKIIEPHLKKSGIEIYEYSQGNMLVFTGKRNGFGDFSAFSNILNTYDVVPKRMRVNIGILEFFTDVTYDREESLKIFDKKGKLIFDLKLPSSPDAKGLEFGVSFNPLYGVTGRHYDFQSIMTVLESSGHAETLVKVDREVSNGQLATLKNISKIPYLTREVIQNSIYEIPKYEETGVTIELTAYYNDAGFITLDITKIESGEQTGWAQREQWPVFRIANLGGKHVVQNGLTHVALSSTFSRYRVVDRGPPFFRKVPIMKDVFTSKSYEKNLSNLIFLIEARYVPRGDLTGIIKKE